jgi:hypothetical protein
VLVTLVNYAILRKGAKGIIDKKREKKKEHPLLNKSEKVPFAGLYNLKRKTVVVFVLATLFIMGIYPPWQCIQKRTGDNFITPSGYHFLFFPPKGKRLSNGTFRGAGRPSLQNVVDLERLFLQWFLVLVVGAIVIVVLRGGNKVNKTRITERGEGDPPKKRSHAEDIPIKTKISHNEQFPYMAELKRTVYSLLLKEKKDEATMLQAKVECDGDTEKAEARYYQLRYQQIVESGKIDELKKKFLAGKKKKADAQIEEAHQRADTEKRARQKRRMSNKVVKDRETGLEWFAGPDEDMDWEKAKSWVEKLDVAGSKWRMPTIKELRGLYNRPRGLEGVDTTKLTNIIATHASKCVWSGEKKGKTWAWYLHFQTKGEHTCDIGVSGSLRAFAVRSRGDG